MAEPAPYWHRVVRLSFFHLERIVKPAWSIVTQLGYGDVPESECLFVLPADVSCTHL